MQISTVTTSIIKLVLKNLKLDKTHISSMFNGKTRFKWSAHFNKQNIGKALRDVFGFSKIQQKEISKLLWKKVGNFQFGQKIIRTKEVAKVVLGIDHAYKGVKRTWSIGKALYGHYKSGGKTPFIKLESAFNKVKEDAKLIYAGGR